MPAAPLLPLVLAAAVADSLADSSILVEHAGTVAHGGDLSPSYTRSFNRTVTFALDWEPARALSVTAETSLQRELTPGETTFDREVLLDDVTIGAELSLTQLGRGSAGDDDGDGDGDGDGGPLDAALALGVALPASKASRAETLVLELRPEASVSARAPLLDGLTFSLAVAPTPRLHRYTTASTRTPRPCSRSAGCTLGSTVDTGQRNVAFQLVAEGGLALAALDERLSVSAQLQLAWSWLYALSPSARWDEATIHDPRNGDGSPVGLATAFTFDVSVDVHAGVTLGVGLWTPGGMRPDGGWYHPLANRMSQVYVDVTLRPVAAVLREMRR